jgi:hypothetical protein
MRRPGVCFKKRGQEDFFHEAFDIETDQPFKLKRAELIANSVLKRIKKAKRYPKKSFVFIEDFAFNARGRTFDIAEAAGIFKYRLHHDWHVPLSNIFLVSIQHIKMYCSCKGNCQKNVMLKEVFKRWGFDTEDDNEADAFVLMQIAEAFKNKKIKITEFQRDVLSRVVEYNRKNR